MVQQLNKQHLDKRQRLLLSVVEQIKLPLTQVAGLAEFGQQKNDVAVWRTVQASIGSALGLVESYSLSLRLQGGTMLPDVEPVTVSALLYDTAQQLTAYASQYNVRLELDMAARLQPVLGDQMVLGSALRSLGYVFIEAASVADSPQKPLVRLSAYRSRYGIVAGLYSPTKDFGMASLRRARALQGIARQPLPELSTNPAAGVFVADSLLQSVASKLHVARYHNLTGLAATLAPSQQLQLV